MDFKQKIKKWRYKKLKGYIFDKIIFNAGMIIIFIFLFIIMANMGFDFGTQIYFNCPNTTNIGICENPFYEGHLNHLPDKYTKKCVYDWCNEPYLPAGFEFGEKPPFIYRLALPFAIFVLILSFVANHLIHNKGRFINVRLEE